MRIICISVLLATLLFTTSVWAKKFTIDSAHSSVEFSVKHLGLIPVKGRFKVFEGSFDFDEKMGVATNINLKIDVDSIDTNEPDRDAHLKGKDFFHVRSATYDVIEKSRYMIFQSASALTKSKFIAGKLTILKTTRPVKLTSVVTHLKEGQETKMIGVQAQGTINRKHFGLTWQKSSTGFLAKAAGKFVGDEVTMTINVLSKPKTQKKQEAPGGKEK